MEPPSNTSLRSTSTTLPAKSKKSERYSRENLGKSKSASDKITDNGINPIATTGLSKKNRSTNNSPRSYSSSSSSSSSLSASPSGSFIEGTSPRKLRNLLGIFGGKSETLADTDNVLKKRLQELKKQYPFSNSIKDEEVYTVLDRYHEEKNESLPNRIKEPAIHALKKEMFLFAHPNAFREPSYDSFILSSVQSRLRDLRRIAFCFQLPMEEKKKKLRFLDILKPYLEELIVAKTIHSFLESYKEIQNPAVKEFLSYVIPSDEMEYLASFDDTVSDEIRNCYLNMLHVAKILQYIPKSEMALSLLYSRNEVAALPRRVTTDLDNLKKEMFVFAYKFIEQHLSCAYFLLNHVQKRLIKLKIAIENIRFRKKKVKFIEDLYFYTNKLTSSKILFDFFEEFDIVPEEIKEFLAYIIPKEELEFLEGYTHRLTDDVSEQYHQMLLMAELLHDIVSKTKCIQPRPAVWQIGDAKPDTHIEPIFCNNIIEVLTSHRIGQFNFQRLSFRNESTKAKIVIHRDGHQLVAKTKKKSERLNLVRYQNLRQYSQTVLRFLFKMLIESGVHPEIEAANIDKVIDKFLATEDSEDTIPEEESEELPIFLLKIIKTIAISNSNRIESFERKHPGIFQSMKGIYKGLHANEFTATIEPLNEVCIQGRKNGFVTQHFFKLTINYLHKENSIPFANCILKGSVRYRNDKTFQITDLHIAKLDFSKMLRLVPKNFSFEEIEILLQKFIVVMSYTEGQGYHSSELEIAMEPDQESEEKELSSN